MKIVGAAACQYCQFQNEDIALTGQREPDEAGGWNWKIAAGARCPRCGEELSWLHEPLSKLTLAPGQLDLAGYRLWKHLDELE